MKQKPIPRLYTLRQLIATTTGEVGCKVQIGNQWVPMRPLGYGGIVRRIKLAWMVFTGKADAVTWPGNQ
ncbi:hypothetical protein D3C85_149310 [compost metagenome]